MSVRTVWCEECREIRTGEDRSGNTVPHRKECPNCGSTEFAAVLDERVAPEE